MKDKKNKATRRFKPSQTYAVISTSLVLFTLGLFCLIFIHGKKLSNYVKESIQFIIIIKDNVPEAQMVEYQKQLSQLPSVKSAEYVSKDKAAERYIDDTGDNFREFLDYNPLFSSIEIRVKADYANADSIKHFEELVKQNDIVSEFWYEKKFIDLANDNFKAIGYVIIALSLLFGLVAYTLVDSTIRLGMYSQRFTLRSMQLVGATKNFITKPFLIKALLNGLISGLIAVTGLVMLLNLLLKFFDQEGPGQGITLVALFALKDVSLNIVLFGVVILVGILFSTISTYLSVRKYLNMKLDELY